jgi:hypothetical protein
MRYVVTCHLRSGAQPGDIIDSADVPGPLLTQMVRAGQLRPAADDVDEGEAPKAAAKPRRRKAADPS